LGYLDGFVAQVPNWDIHVVSSPAARAAHDLVARYPQFRHHADAPDGGYAAAVLLNQPWEIGQVVGLHRQAFVTAFVVLDTIAWDIHPGQTRLDATWRFIAQHADGLFYISHFTKERFNQRFPVSAGVSETVTHLSFAQEDHVRSLAPRVAVKNQILVFGNDYVHKDVRPTVQLLADAFPFHRITMFGVEHAPSPNVTAIPSGHLSRTTLHDLIAGAGVMVFPSYYEGFGLPVVEGLAYGRPVLVRRSALWNEIAAFSRLPGKLIDFDDAASLVEGVGLATTELPSGTALPPGTAPANWTECVKRMVELLTERLAMPVVEHWWLRESALRILE
jgi:glycosyltransferase involved in cell wall biosynthesis